MDNAANNDFSDNQHFEIGTFGGGCFWCTEAIYQNLKGVVKIKSGYSGGHIDDPTYREVTSGTSGHAEVIQILYDPGIISYRELLEVFWFTHDPTTLNRQGADVGPQYRSVVFYHTDEQAKEAVYLKDRLDSSNSFPKPIVTEIEAYNGFYEAEAYHQNYYKDNSTQPYCQFVIKPKLAKFQEVFSEKLNYTHS